MSGGKAVVTQVTMVTVNEVSPDEESELLASNNADSLDEVADDMKESVATLMANRVFGDADKIPILDVNTQIADEYRPEEYSDIRQE